MLVGDWERGVTQRRTMLTGMVTAGWSIGAAMGMPRVASAAVLSGARADRLIVLKSERRLYMLRDGEVVRSYRVALGRVPRGTKIYQGDGRTPEGVYRCHGVQPR